MDLQDGTLPVVLTIAGSDSGGGAGIQADLKTFAALGCFGASAITAITAQNPREVTAIQAIDPAVVAAQVEAVGAYFPVGAAKTGMLFSTEVIEAVAGAFRNLKPPRGSSGGRDCPPLVVDPVMVATSGAKLLDDGAMAALREKILPLATLVTPNMGEAAILSGMEVSAEAHLEPAARAIHDRFGVSVLVKGGHLSAGDELVDVLVHEGGVLEFRGERIAGVNTHGTGCTLSAAIAVFLMRGGTVPDAVARGRDYLRGTLAHGIQAGEARGLNHGFAPRPLQVV
jgi:hydroxymethylpyrimidine kinase/phosphomethylpyrimidine kinase